MPLGASKAAALPASGVRAAALLTSPVMAAPLLATFAAGNKVRQRVPDVFSIAEFLLDYCTLKVFDTVLPWEVAAMSIHSFVTPGAFDPEAMAAMDGAFNAACKALGDTGQPKIVLEIIAQRIVEAASRGERNPVRLVKAALPWHTRE
jgi:hypothetical protein